MTLKLNYYIIFQVLQCNYIRQAIDLLEGLIPKRDDNKDISKDHLEKLIVFAIMWSLGALLEQADRRKVRGKIFSIFFFTLDRCLSENIIKQLNAIKTCRHRIVVWKAQGLPQSK